MIFPILSQPQKGLQGCVFAVQSCRKAANGHRNSLYHSNLHNAMESG